MYNKNKNGYKMNNKLLYVLIFVIIVLITCVIGGSYLIYSTMNHNEKPKEEIIIEEKAVIFKYEFSDLILNINDNKGNSKLLKISFAVKSGNEKLTEIMEKYNSDITDSLISIISTMDSTALLTVPGKILLKESMIKEFNLLLENNDMELKNTIKEVLFISLIIK